MRTRKTREKYKEVNCYKLPEQSTRALPTTDAMIEIMAYRFERNEELWHPDDGRLNAEISKMVIDEMNELRKLNFKGTLLDLSWKATNIVSDKLSRGEPGRIEVNK